MDPYTIGRLALPVVIGIMAVAAILTLAMGIFTAKVKARPDEYKVVSEAGSRGGRL